jgi:hypothetical protein
MCDDGEDAAAPAGWRGRDGYMAKHMQGAKAPGTRPDETPLAALLLRPIHGKTDEAFTVSLEDELLSLISPDGRMVMMLPRGEAVRHLRFNFDIFRGRTVSFVVIEGAKAYTFKCPLLELEQLLSWLPQKPQVEREREVRHYAVALILLGTGMLLFQEFFFGPWALLLTLAGVSCVVLPHRFMYGINAGIMFFISMVLFFSPRPLGLSPGENIETVRLLSTGLGSVLILWSVEQMSMMGPIHRLRMAREHYAAGSLNFCDDTPAPAVRLVALGMLLLGLFFLAHLGWVAVLEWRGLGSQEGNVYDWLLYATASFTTLVGALALYIWDYRAYLEAKIAGQFSIVLFVFYAAGITKMALQDNLPLSPYALSEGLFAFANIYVWVPLVVLVVLFNRWFTRAVEKDLESRTV